MFDLSSVWLILPMIIVGCGAMLVLLMGTFSKFNDKHIFQTTIAVLAFALFELFLRYHAPFSLEFGHSFQFDDEASMFKIVILTLVMAILLYSKPVFETFKVHLAEAYTLILLSTMGMMLLVSAMHLVTIFLGIELMSLPLYALVALYRDDKLATEAALKYFIMGALSSGLLLFGFAWLYGATGSLDLTQISTTVTYNHVWLLIAQGLILSGIAFKFGAAPFHMWVPDVYEAAPTSVAALIATAPKVAMTALLLHLMQAFAFDAGYWAQMLTVIAIVSMLLGNIVALVQDKIKRLLAYSSVGHMGIIFLAVANNTHMAVASSVMYIIIYSFTTLLAFAVLMQIKVNYQSVIFIKDLSGLSKHYALLAFSMMIAMFSMAGVPPLVGFMAKFMVLDVLISSKSFLAALVLILCSVIGAFYYIRVIKALYFQGSSGSSVLLANKVSKLLMSINSCFLVLIGIAPFMLWGLINNVIN